jgi:phosphopantothenoylcysteine decarboxylase/phosphopantothenate--cysteine ligase
MTAANSLRDKNIIIGICGGIAAYKIPLLIRLLKKSGANVKVVCTKSALDFVTLGTLSTVSQEPVMVDFMNPNTGEWNNHVELGLWADYMLIAPCTSNTLAKMANGQADNLLLATYMSCRGKVFISPAMDLDMFEHPGVKKNIEFLVKHGVSYIEPNTGSLASGLDGKGRLPEPEELFEELCLISVKSNIWKGKTILMTAGPTHEKLDPVRFIGNYSSGKMGYSIAEAFAQCGADVHLVTGPTHINKPAGVTIYNVTSATEMNDKVVELFSKADVAIMTAAVADYRPKDQSNTKIKKKNDDGISLELIQNPDILAGVGKNKSAKQYVVGFALETHNELENAKGKLEKKNADMIVLNSANAAGGVFGSDENEVSIVTKSQVIEIERMSKRNIAFKLCEIIHENYEKLL